MFLAFFLYIYISFHPSVCRVGGGASGASAFGAAGTERTRAYGGCGIRTAPSLQGKSKPHSI